MAPKLFTYTLNQYFPKRNSKFLQWCFFRDYTNGNYVFTSGIDKFFCYSEKRMREFINDIGGVIKVDGIEYSAYLKQYLNGNYWISFEVI